MREVAVTVRSSCLLTRRSVSAAIDQEAAAGELCGAALHLTRCADCRRFFAEIDTISSLLRATPIAPRNLMTPRSASAWVSARRESR